MFALPNSLIPAFAIAGVFSLMHPIVNAQVNRCVDASGRVEYRATPCERNTQSRTLPAEAGFSSTAPAHIAQPSLAKRETYSLEGDVLMAMSPDSGKKTPVQLPTNFPSFSWPTGVAHDIDLDVVTVVTKGGEGFLYRYDVKRKQWLDVRSLKDVDIKSLHYVAARKHYAALTEKGTVIFISNQGEPLVSTPTAAQSGVITPDVASSRYSPPATPVNEPQLQIVDQVPPRDLAAGAELFVVSGYEPTQGIARLRVNRPGKRVVLVLSSYEKVLWRIEAVPRTAIAGILVSSFEGNSGAISDNPIPAYRTQLPYADKTDSANFRQILQQLNAWFGTARVDAFQGEYRLPSLLELNAPSPATADLTLKGIAATAPTSFFDLSLLSNDLQVVRLRNDGQSSSANGQRNLQADNKVVLSGTGLQAFSLVKESLEITDLQSGQRTKLPLPAQYPPFSWATSVAYDVDLDIVTVVTLGGEGFFYRYDARHKKWLDYRSMNNIDITSLAYDTHTKRYRAWRADGALLTLSKDGALVSSKNLKDGLPGFGALFDNVNGRPPPLKIVPHGAQVAIVAIQNNEVAMIWTYHERSESVQLTYKRENATAKAASR